jgi:PTH1 family peptidyl-tRNA hydrolase
VRLGIGHPGHKDRVTGHVLGNFAKAEMEPLAELLGAVAADVPWLLAGDEARFMSEIALRTVPQRQR